METISRANVNVTDKTEEIFLELLAEYLQEEVKDLVCVARCHPKHVFEDQSLDILIIVRDKLDEEAIDRAITRVHDEVKIDSHDIDAQTKYCLCTFEYTLADWLARKDSEGLIEGLEKRCDTLYHSGELTRVPEFK